MLVEIQNKGGKLCSPAKEGKLRCPLMVRTTSEDVVTDHLFSTLRCINPTWWLPDLLNQGLGQQRFHRQIFRNLKIKLWVKQRQVPKWLVPWNEGQTEVDVVITWSNPSTMVFIEMKYGSPIAKSTANAESNGKYPADQIIRNIRIGLWKCGLFHEKELFTSPPTRFLMLLIAPKVGNQFIQKYRTESGIRKALPKGELLKELPQTPIVGEASYRQIIKILKANHRFLSRSEKTLAKELCNYLEFKSNQLK